MHVLRLEQANTVYTGEYTSYPPCMQNSNLTHNIYFILHGGSPQSQLLILHLTVPRQLLPPKTPRRTSPSLLHTSENSNPFESGLTGSRSFSHGAIPDCASPTPFLSLSLSLSHTHTHIYIYTYTCTHSPSISLFVRLHPSAWSGGESRFKSPDWIIPLSSFTIHTFFSPPLFPPLKL